MVIRSVRIKQLTVLALSVIVSIAALWIIGPSNKASAASFVTVDIPYREYMDPTTYSEYYPGGSAFQTVQVNYGILLNRNNPLTNKDEVRGDATGNLTPYNPDNPGQGDGIAYAFDGGGTIPASVWIADATEDIPYEYQICDITHDICSDFFRLKRAGGTTSPGVVYDSPLCNVSGGASVGVDCTPTFLLGAGDNPEWPQNVGFILISATNVAQTNNGQGGGYEYQVDGFVEPVPDRGLICEDLDGSMGWILCIVLNWIDSGIESVESGINNFLFFDQLYNGGGVYEVWQATRNIALLILVPITLVMVIGTALSFGPFDPYTVKRALPRMIAATIFIVLSWEICTFVIDIVDIVGGGLLNFIERIGGIDRSISLRSLFAHAGGDATAPAGGAFAAVLLGGYSAFALGQLSIGIIFSLAIAALMTLLVGYIALALRLILLLGMLVLSPVFILSWIFPGNDKMWKFWKTSFFGMLLLFPLIVGAIGIGRLGAFIISNM